jgi:hypothetical protein
MDLPQIDRNVAEGTSEDGRDQTRPLMAQAAEGSRSLAIGEKIGDLIALKQMADYLKNELQRLHSRCGPIAGVLPQMISEEICDLLLDQAESG